MTRTSKFALFVIAAVTFAVSAQTQVPPNASEVARYSGSHAAAHRGDVATIEKLAAQGAPLDARGCRAATRSRRSARCGGVARGLAGLEGGLEPHEVLVHLGAGIRAE